MANIVGGNVVWTFDADTGQFDIKVDNARKKVEEFGNTVKSKTSTVNQFSTDASNAFNSVADSIQNVGLKLLAVTVGAGSLGALFLKSAADMEMVSQSMRVLVGDTQVANKLFAQLFQYANVTPFEFSDIANAGRVLLGYGITADKLMPTIEMLGDIAAVTGANFKQLSVVYGQVNAAGRLMGQDSLQLINNNIPLTNILTKKLGITAAQLRKEMEKGAISADMFNQALMETTQAGGFAFQGTDVLAKTFLGRLSTLKDAVYEFGRNLLGVKIDPELGLTIKKGGIFDTLSQAVPKITAELQKLTPTLEKISSILVENLIPAIGSLVAVWATMKVGAFTAAIVSLIPQIGIFVTSMQAGASVTEALNVAMLANPAMLLVTAIALVVGALVFLQIKFKIFNKAWDGIQRAFNASVEFLKNSFDDLKTFTKNFVESVSNEFQKIKDGVSNAFGAIKDIVINSFNSAKNAVVGAIKSIYDSIVTVLTAIWSFISPILKFILDLFIIVFGSILIVVLDVLIFLKGVFLEAFTYIWGVVSNVLGAIRDVFILLFGIYLAIITTVLNYIRDFIVDAFNYYKEIIVTAFTAVLEFIQGVWNKIYEVITSIVKKIIDFFAPAFKWLFERGKDIVNGLISGIKSLISAVTEAAQSVWNAISSFFSGAWNWLYQVGKDIVNGLIRGIKDMIGAVSKAADEVGEAVKKRVKTLLGISSPSKIMMQYGEWTMQGFAQGIKNGNNAVLETIGGSLSPLYEPSIMPTITDVPIEDNNSQVVNHIGTINIGSEVDGENWLKKLTRDDEVTKMGLINYAL